MHGGRLAETLADVYVLNATARTARKLCTDVIRQTSAKPYYGKRGGAAFYAPHDESDEQRKRMAEAVQLLSRATDLLRDAAVSGGIAEAHLHEVARMDYDFGRGQIVTHDDVEDVAADAGKNAV